ncbi:MAG: LytTR family DNA-binding domain-containing protein [Oscillospiraceae bacterium]|nr:LytTR family DNA-binding domain-containing protein [Oscillospiraceae bacterium]
MIKIAICDDENFFVDELQAQVKDFFLEKRIEFQVTEYLSGKELAEHAHNHDLIFLDIKMQEQDGFKTAEILRENGFSGHIIFVTIMKDEVYKAFEYEAFDYLVKPLSKIAFEHTMERFLRTLKSSGKQLIVTRKIEQRIINLSDILYCEVINRKINLHLSDGNIIEYYGKISELEQRLGKDFFKSHRSYLVNLKYITGYNSNEITRGSKEKLPLSRGRKNALMSALISDIDNNGEV